MTAAGRPGGSRGPAGLSIGAVLARLRPEFPDVTISKLRFLESEGLLSPARTPSGYRQFSESDIERLRFVLQAQRDQYLPLKVIKERLDAPDDGQGRGEAADSRDVVSLPDAASSGDDDGTPSRLTREDLIARAGIDQAMLAELEQYGLVRSGAAGFYDPDGLRVATVARAMTDFGIEPRHLRAFQASADRETALLEQVVAPMARHGDPESAARADDTRQELAALAVTLHSLLVRVGLRRGGGA